MTLTQLRYFIHVVSLRSFSRAADQLHVASSALSRQVRLLEEEIDAPLLVRDARGIEATQAGRLLFDRANELLRMADQTRAVVRERAGATEGTLRVGFNPSLATLFASRAIRDLRRRLPGVQVQVGEGLTAELKDRVLDRRLDIAAVTAPEPHPDLAIQLLFWEHLWLVGAPDRTGKAPQPSLADLGKVPLVQTTPSNAVRLLLDEAAARAGVRPQIVVETDNLPLIKELVRDGVGYHVSPYSAFRVELEKGTLVGAPLRPLRISRALVRRADEPLSRAVVAFTDFVQAQVRRDVPARQLLLPRRAPAAVDKFEG